MKLSKAEERLMEHLWKLKKVFLKDLLDDLPDPKPAVTTVSTMLKRMQDKGFVGYKLYGNSREYYPLVPKSKYFSKQVNGIIKTFFNDSVTQFGTFFVCDTSLTTKELEDLRTIIDEEIKRKGND